MPMLKLLLLDEDTREGIIWVLTQLARGNMPLCSRDLMFRVQILALEKESGNIRPVIIPPV
eukprot:1428587-Prorocentrum_lima.AAC.1